MPKETFFNLPGEKRQRIIDHSIREFAAFPLERSSLSRIVDSLGIAKGSMYQYFANKEDLYLFIVRLVYAKKKDYLKDVFEQNTDFFAMLRAYYQRSYMFSVEFPEYHRVISNFWESRDENVRQQVMESKELRALDFKRLLRQAVEKGQVNPDVNHEAAFFVYHSVGKELIDQFQELSADEQTDHLEFIRQVLDVLAVGLRVRHN